MDVPCCDTLAEHRSPTRRVDGPADHRVGARPPRLSRRRALLAAGTACLPVASRWRGLRGHPAAAREATPHAATTAAAIPTSGEAVPELAGFDRVMTALMAAWDLPGSQLAVAQEGRLVLNRGYGLADRDQDLPVQPEALFRIASVSKAITAVAILALVDDGLLALDDKALSLLDLDPPAKAQVDPRLAEITIEHLLVHAGGWDMAVGWDPQSPPWSGQAAVALGAPQPSTAETIVRFMLGIPLDFAPGSRSVYSNFGFNVLGRVIERVSGQPYEEFTRHRILAPSGIEAMRLGRSFRADRAPGEVCYYAPAGQPPSPSAFPGGGFVPLGEGAYAVESFDAHGGWIASAADLVRFATAVDGQRGASLLSPATVAAMLHTPRPPSTGGAESTFGLGWDVEPGAEGVGWSHAGALVGSTAAWLERTADGVTIAFVFNTQPEDVAGFFPAAVMALRTAAAAVRTWPAHDLFTA
jgi:N-acyl-D-amino-acid deacylase